MLMRAIAIAGVLALTVGLLWCDITTECTEFCRECLLWRRVHGRSFGWDHNALEYNREVTQSPDTALWQDFYGPSHEHTWVCSLVFYARCLGYLEDGHGDGSFPSQIGAAYNHDPRFREFIQGRIASGHLSASRFRKMVATLSPGEGPDSADLFSHAASLLEEGRRANH